MPPKPISRIFLYQNLFFSDIVVIGLQEYAPLSLMTAMLGPGEEKLKRWDLIITSHLNKLSGKTQYVKFQSKIMMGLCTLVYGKKEIMNLVSKISTTKVKTGFQGAGENKGAVIIRYLCKFLSK